MSSRRLRDHVEKSNIQNLRKGERTDGSVQDNYSAVSQSKYGKPNAPIKLFDSGDFYDSLTAEYNDSIRDIVVKADTIKVDFDGAIDLADEYSTNKGKILGVKQDQKEQGRKIIYEEARKEITKILKSI